jgi:hypothetical protein
MGLKTISGLTFNVTRKKFFFRVLIKAEAVANEVRVFTGMSGQGGLTEFDTNWEGDTGIPSGQILDIEAIGFKVVTPDGSPVLEKTMNRISQSIVTIIIGKREIKKGTLEEFFKGSAKATLDSAFTNVHTGPSFIALPPVDSKKERLNEKETLDFRIKHIGALGQDVYIIPFIDGTLAAKVS